MSEPLRVALLIESSRSYGRKLLAGIAAYARAFGPWTFYYEERVLGDPTPARLKHWRPQGIIARLEDQSLARAVVRLGLPTIDVLCEERVPGISGVIPHHEAIVRLVVQHLRERRLQHFAYCGLPSVRFSERRCDLYVASLAKHGFPVDVFTFCPRTRRIGLAALEAEAMSRDAELADWLRRLPKPVGLMACNDMRAYQVLSVCREYGILVPDEVAVIGVDNDALQCALCDPPLSSIDNDAQRIGYEAAALLHRLVKGHKRLPAVTHIEPLGVVTRRSTDVLAVADREVVEIVRYLRDQACNGLTVAGLARHAAVSRSTLERWFAEHVGHSVRAEICRVRLERVKDLLATSDLPLAEIAKSTGFTYAETMQRLFRKAMHQTPGQYRNRHRHVGRPIYR